MGLVPAVPSRAVAATVLALLVLLPGVLAQGTLPPLPPEDDNGNDGKDTPQSDLYVQGLRTFPRKPVDGEELHLCAYFGLRGERPHGTVSAALYLDGREIKYETYRDVDHDGITLCDIKTAEYGGHAFGARIDLENDVDEANEENNHLTMSFSVAERPLPDLYVDWFRILPSEVPREGRFHLVAHVKNEGAAASPPAAVEFLWDGEPVGTRETPHLRPGQAANILLPMHSSEIPGGIHQAGVRVDATNRTGESREDNNHAQVTLRTPYRVRPDLAIVNLEWDAAGPDGDDPAPHGTPVNLTATVVNRGLTTAPPTPVAFHVDNHPPVATAHTSHLEPGDVTQVQVTWTARYGGHGLRNLTAHADPEGRLRELNVTNNDAQARIRVEEPPAHERMVDLAVTRLVHAPDPARADDPLNLTTVVINHGAREAAGVRIVFHVNGVEIASRPGGRVPPGAAVTAVARWAPPAAGTWRVTATAVATDGLEEAHARNNVRTLNLTVDDAVDPPPVLQPDPADDADGETPDTPDPVDDTGSDTDAGGDAPAPEPRLGHAEAVDVYARPVNDTEANDYEFVVRVHNPTDGVATGFSVRFHVDGAPHGASLSVNGLAPHANRTVVSQPWEGDEGKYRLSATLTPMDGSTWPRNTVEGTFTVDDGRFLPTPALLLTLVLVAIAAARLPRKRA